MYLRTLCGTRPRNRLSFTLGPCSIGTLRRASAIFCGACLALCANFQCFLFRAASRKAEHLFVPGIWSSRSFSSLVVQR